MARGSRRNNQSNTLNIERFTSDGAAGLISAWQSGLSANDNEGAHRNLSAKIRSMNYGVTIIEGQWIRLGLNSQSGTTPEKAILLAGDESDSGNMKGFLKKMMAEYGQKAVIYNAAQSSEIILLSSDGVQTPVTLSELQRFSSVYQQMRGVTDAEFCLGGTSIPKNWISRLAEQVKNKGRSR